MSVSTVAAPKHIMQKDLFRLSAAFWSGFNVSPTNADMEKAIIQAVLYENGNNELSLESLLNKITEHYFCIVTETSILQSIDNHRTEFIRNECQGYVSYSLSKQRFSEIQAKEESSLNLLATQLATDKNVYSVDEVQQALEKYFYDLTTTNLNTFLAFFGPLGMRGSESLKEFDLSVDTTTYTDNDLEIIGDFGDWENLAKETLVLDVILCTLEYCLFCSGDAKNYFADNSLDGYKLYLDTNIIFRALGINGMGRQTLLKAFLNKCKQLNVSLMILTFTKTEFFNTVDNYIDNITQYSRGLVYPGAFAAISDYSMYDYYNDWIIEHPEGTPIYFKACLRTEYDLFIKECGIITEPKSKDTHVLNHFEAEEKKVINAYGNQIVQVKRKWKEGKIYFNYDEDYHKSTNLHDAILMRYVEKQIEDNHSLKIAIISSDKSYRYWDYIREKEYSPVIMYPSHFLALLIKITGRATDDAKCFSKLVNLKTRSKKIEPRMANIIVSGISSVTEDIKNQRLLVSSVFSEQFQHMLSDCNSDPEVYEQVKLYSQNFLKKEMEVSEQENAKLEETIASDKKKIDKLQEQVDTIRERNIIIEQNAIQERQENTVLKRELARLSTRQKLMKRVYLKPMVFLLILTASVICAVLTIFFTDWKYNFVAFLLNWMESIAFGEYIVGVVVTYILGLAAVCWGLSKKMWFKFWDKQAVAKLENELIDNYLNETNLSDKNSTQEI